MRNFYATDYNELFSNIFTVVEMKDIDSKNRHAVYHFVNEHCQIGEEELIKIKAPSHRIKQLVFDIYYTNPHYLNFIKEFRTTYTHCSRGTAVGEGFIVIGKEFADKVIKEAFYQIIDPGFAIWKGALKYDLTNL